MLWKDVSLVLKVFKGIFFCVVAFCLLTANGIRVNAQTIEEQDNNDTIGEAQYISANRETAAGCVNGTYSGQYVVNGYTSNTDDDWYKVMLSSGTQYITCNGASYSFEVYNSSEQIVYSNTYINSGTGMKAYAFTASASDFYYVHVLGVSSTSSNYKLLVGGPTYSVSNYSTSLGSFSLSGSDVTKTVNTGSVSGIPTGAIAYSLSITNVASTSTNGVTVVNSGTTLSLPSSNLSKSGLVSYNMRMSNSWRFTFKYKKNVSINPRITIYYVYPVTSGLVQ